ncbi:MAG TPA: calcium-binding protein, partial [Methylocystis sp.]
MATFTATTGDSRADATTGTLINFTGGTVAELTDNVGDIFIAGQGFGSVTVIAGGGDDDLRGGMGDDTLRGGAGKDVLDGGTQGHDTADYRDKTTSVVVTLNGSTNAVVFVDGVAEDTIRNIQDVTGGSGNDRLTGDAHGNVLLGGAGDDILKGGAGRDVFYGGEGVDTLDYSDERVSVVLALSDGPIFASATVGDIVEGVVDIENVVGGSGDDSLTGNSSANALDGGAGVDLVDYSNKTSSVVVALKGATNSVVTVGGVAEDVIRNFENVIGGS